MSTNMRKFAVAAISWENAGKHLNFRVCAAQSLSVGVRTSEVQKPPSLYPRAIYKFM